MLLVQGGHIVRLKHAEAEGLLAAWLQSLSPLHSQKLHQLRRSVQRSPQPAAAAEGTVLSLFGGMDVAKRQQKKPALGITTSTTITPEDAQIALLVGTDDAEEESSGSSSSLWEVRCSPVILFLLRGKPTPVCGPQTWR